MRPIEHQVFQREGFLRIVWYGRVTAVPSESQVPLLTAYLAPIEMHRGEPVSPRITSRAERYTIPAGDIPRLPINSIINGNRIVYPFGKVFAPFEQRTLSLDFTQRNLTPFQRFAQDENGQYIVPISSISRFDDTEYPGALLGIGNGEDAFAVVIPCFEVFRFFYATSSRLANVFVDTRFLDPSRHVWNPDRSVINRTERTAKVWLRQRMLDTDARMIAAFAFSKYAVEQGKNIFLNIAKGAGANERTLQALPPFEGSTTVEAVCKPFVGPRGQPRILITRLIHCDWRPDFDQLVFDRDNDGRSAGGGDEITEPLEREPHVEVDDLGDDDEVPASLWTEPPASQFAPVELVDEDLAGRFPQLESVATEKLPQIENTHHGANIRRKKRERWNTELSTVEGTSSTSELGPALLTGGYEEVATYVGDPESMPQPPDEQILRIAKSIANVHRQGLAQVVFLPVFKPSYPIEDIKLFLLPNSIHRIEWPWLYHDKADGRRRKGFAAEVSVGWDERPRFRYVLDFEPKSGKQGSIAVVWNDDEGVIDPETLIRVVAAFAAKGNVWLKEPVFLGMQIGRRNHTTDDDFWADAESVLDRIMSTEPAF